MNNCPYCSRDVAVEISGIWVHKLPDRWVSCNPMNQKPRGDDELAEEHESCVLVQQT